MLTRGVQRTSVDPKSPVPIVLRVSGGSSIIGDDLSNEQITVSIKDAIKLNASALAMSVFVGSKYEQQTIVNLGKLVNEAVEKISNKQVNVSQLITHKYNLEECQQAFVHAKSGDNAMKIIISN